MAERQQALADAILKDPDVASLSSFIGVDGVNMSLNSGRMLITLKPRDERGETASRDHSPARSGETQNVTGISIAMQPVQDLTIDSTVGSAQYMFFLENPERVDDSRPGRRGWSSGCEQIAGFRGRLQRSRAQGPAARC